MFLFITSTKITCSYHLQIVFSLISAKLIRLEFELSADNKRPSLKKDGLCDKKRPTKPRNQFQRSMQRASVLKTIVTFVYLFFYSIFIIMTLKKNQLFLKSLSAASLPTPQNKSPRYGGSCQQDLTNRRINPVFDGTKKK